MKNNVDKANFKVKFTKNTTWSQYFPKETTLGENYF